MSRLFKTHEAGARTINGMTNQTHGQIRARMVTILSELSSLLDRIDDGQRALPTPCTEYDVAALANHVIGWLENFAAGFASDDGTCPRADVTDVVVATGDAPGRVRVAARALDEAIRGGGAQRPLVIAAQGGMPGDIALSMMLSEYVLHGWDFARATGLPWDPAEEIVTASHDFLQHLVTPEYRGPEGMFADEVPVPADAPTLDRLVAFAGRDPGWDPARQ